MMATESPVRMVESGGPTKWPPAKGVALFASRLHNMASDELEVLLKAQKFREDPRNMVPNRSGSAPPSMEGSHAAYGNLMGPQSSNVKSSMINLRSSAGNCKSEEKLCTDPTNIAFHYSNMNLNPRLPRPRFSRENKGQCSSTGCLGNDWRLTSFDDSGNGSLHFAGNSLSTHKEEPEDDKPDDSSESGNVFIPEYDESPLAARHKSLVDLIQADFPRTPSPLYNLSHSSSHATADECIDHDIQAISLDDLSLSASKLSDSISGSANTCVDMSTEGPRTYGITSNENPLPNNLLKGSNRVTIAESRSPQDVQLINKNFGPGDKVIQSGGTRSDVFPQQQSNGKHLQLQQHMTFPQLCFTYPVHGVQSQVMMSEGLSPSQHSMEESHSKISPEVQQQFLQPHGLTPPLYATAAGFMTTSGNPFYPGSPPFSGLYPPNYGVSGGYTLNSPFCPPFVAGYPSHLTGMQMQYDSSTSGQSFNGRAASFSSADVVAHTGDLQHLNKFFRGQQGLMPSQPSLSEPALQMQMQFFQQSREDPFGGQYGWLAPVDALRGQVGSFSSEKQATGTAAAYRVDQKLQPIANGNPSIPNPRRAGELAASGYYVSPPMTQYWASPLGSPLMPSSPAAGSNIPGRRNELQFSQGSSTNLGIYTGWQGQRGVDSLSGHKKYSILDELKSSSGRKIDLSDIAGRIVEFSVDQHGSRFIQQKLENCGVEEKESVFREVLPHVSKLMTDVFGNYVIQKFFEYGSREQRKQLADQLSGKILPLTLQMYGCRVIQKALEVIELDQKTELMLELDGHVMRCVRDQNGNHVIQKCIESIPMEKIGFIISSFQGHVATLSTHPYGCRVIQRVLEHCGDESQSQCIVDEILESAYILAQDQYGNYVTQHVLERGKPHERSQIISKLTGRIVQMSQHKYASNVVEKCLEHGDAAERERLVEEILGQSDENNNLLTMMKDQFANYVVQKILETSNDKQREVLLNRIRINLQALKKYTYGKHIVARFDQLCSEEAEASES